MPRRDEISETKKQRLQQEQERLQKLMFDARSSVRRSSLKGQSDTESENRLYPPLGKPNATTDDETISHSESVATLWPKLNKDRQAIKEPLEEPAAQETPLSEKELFPATEFLADNVEEKEVLQKVADDRNTERPPLTEKDLFPETDIGMDVLHQPEENVVKVMWLEQSNATTIEQHQARPVEEVITREATMDGALDFQEERIWQIEEPIDADPTEDLKELQKRSKSGSYAAMLFAALLLGFGGYYFYTKNQPNDNTLAEKDTKPASVPVSKTPVIPSTDSVLANNKNVVKPEAAKPIRTEIKKDPEERKPEKPAAKPPVVENKAAAAPVTETSSSLGQYKVISKAYFHNEPDESTRRKAFIIHWNNAVLTPLEEEKGFVYIVFTNHLGQTSKGWLRKKDLKPLN